MKLIDPSTTAPKIDDTTYRLLMDYSLRIMGRKQYSVRELTNKMKLKVKRLEKYKPLTNVELSIQRVLDRLQEWNYLSDKKIIDSAIEASTTFKPQGRNAFMASMMKKGISKDDAQTAWESKHIDERALALEVVKKYLPKYKRFPAQECKRKLAGALARKGFSGDVVWSTVERFSA